jgi:hypothetical protein
VRTRVRLTPSLGATLFVAANALAFAVIRPGVPDLWAALARASAVRHGVGLTYWFGWFGGSTPGSYSVVTPYFCAALGTALTAGLAALACSWCASALVRTTARPVLASYVAAFGIVSNLWCGRVPFLVGCAFGTGALLLVQRRRAVPAALLGVMAALASPVAGAFLCLGLTGTLLARSTRDYRAVALIAMASTTATMLSLAVLFGMPGPEPFPLYLIGEVVLVLSLLLALAPPAHLRITLILSALAALVLFVIPNGLGANDARFALFCLPVAAVALSHRRRRVLLALTAPILVLSSLSSVSAVISATRPGSSADYYDALAHELDTLPALPNHRLELVNAGHAGYAALLDHAALARGWETQQDRALNSNLYVGPLDTETYRAWLDENAVGYVAVDTSGGPSPEVHAVFAARREYLHRIWAEDHWQLYEVQAATPIVPAPAVLTTSTQAAMTVQVPCACRITVRVRWSPYLDVTTQLPDGTSDTIEDTFRPALNEDGTGWTTLTTNQAGTYVLA